MALKQVLIASRHYKIIEVAEVLVDDNTYPYLLFMVCNWNANHMNGGGMALTGAYPP